MIATSATSQNFIKKTLGHHRYARPTNIHRVTRHFSRRLFRTLLLRAPSTLSLLLCTHLASRCVCVRESESARLCGCVSVCLSVPFLRHSWAMRWECATKLWCKTEAAPYFDFSVLFGSQSDHEILGELRNTTRSSNSLTSFFASFFPSPLCFLRLEAFSIILWILEVSPIVVMSVFLAWSKGIDHHLHYICTYAKWNARFWR